MARMYGTKDARLHGLAVGIIVGGVAIMVTGVGLEWVELRLDLMAMLGLDVTAFGLAARLGGAMVLGGIVMLAIRPVPVVERDQPPQNVAEGPELSPLHGLRAARAAAALRRARNIPTA